MRVSPLGRQISGSTGLQNLQCDTWMFDTYMRVALRMATLSLAALYLQSLSKVGPSSLFD